MKYWLIIHSIEAYSQHNDFIGKDKKQAGKIDSIKKGDKIVYYATGDSVVVGTFDVISSKKEWVNDKYWKGPHICFKIRPRKLASRPHYIKIHNLINEIDPPLSIFQDRKFQPIKLKGRTAIEITKTDFFAIEKYIKTYVPKETSFFKKIVNDENLGEPIDLEVMNYAPTSEQGVVALFAYFMGNLKSHKFVKIEFIRLGFPDSCVIEKIGNKFARKYIEFEFKASKFREHIKNKEHREIKCDYVVCWENDFPTCPVEVIELKEELLERNKR